MEAKQFKSEVRSDSEASGLPEVVVFNVGLHSAQLIARLSSLAVEHGLKMVEVFDNSATYLKEGDGGGEEPVNTELGVLRVSGSDFWFAAYVKHTKIMVLSDRYPVSVLNEHFGQSMDGVDAELLEPKVAAEAHSDDRRVETKFDAARWLAQASDEDIVRLANCGWGGDYPADAVAEFMAAHDANVEALFSYTTVLQKAGVKDVGYECTVDPRDAMSWLQKHRQGVWAKVTCEVNEVTLVEAQEEEILGRWDWLDGKGNASECSLETEHEAALDAVKVLSLEPFPR